MGPKRTAVSFGGAGVSCMMDFPPPSHCFHAMWKINSKSIFWIYIRATQIDALKKCTFIQTKQRRRPKSCLCSADMAAALQSPSLLGQTAFSSTRKFAQERSKAQVATAQLSQVWFCYPGKAWCKEWEGSKVFGVFFCVAISQRISCWHIFPCPVHTCLVNAIWSWFHVPLLYQFQVHMKEIPSSPCLPLPPYTLEKPNETK